MVHVFLQSIKLHPDTLNYHIGALIIHSLIILRNKNAEHNHVRHFYFYKFSTDLVHHLISTTSPFKNSGGLLLMLNSSIYTKVLRGCLTLL